MIVMKKQQRNMASKYEIEAQNHKEIQSVSQLASQEFIFSCFSESS